MGFSRTNRTLGLRGTFSKSKTFGSKGAIASLASVAKIPYDYAQDGISNTFSIVPSALGKVEEDRIKNLVGMLDGYFHDGGHHITVNVMNQKNRDYETCNFDQSNINIYLFYLSSSLIPKLCGNLVFPMSSQIFCFFVTYSL
jgi:Glycine radical